MAPLAASTDDGTTLLQRCSAWGAAAALHLLLGWWLMGSTRQTPGSRDDTRISLRWLLPDAPPQPPPLPTPALPNASQSPARRQATMVTSAKPPTPARTARADALPAPIGTPALDLSLPAGSIDGGDGISAEGVATRVIGRREVHAAFLPRRPPFRLRPQMSPQQKLQAISAFIGLWPPGYKVDPCELARQDMHYLQNAMEASERQALRDAVHEVSAHCR